MEQKYNSNIQDKQICVSASVMRSRYISQRAKLVYGYLCSRFVEAGKGEISRKEICAELGITQDTLGKSLNQLEENHIIKRQASKEDDRKRYSNNRYFISFDNNIPIPCDDVTDNEDVSLTIEPVSDNKNIPISSENVTDKNIPVSSGNAMDTHNNSITDVLDTDIDIVSEKPTIDNTDITSSVIDTIPIHTEKVMDTEDISILSESVTDTADTSILSESVTVTTNDIPMLSSKVMDTDNIPVPCSNATDTDDVILSEKITDSKNSTSTVCLF